MYSWIFMPVRDVIAASQDESLICRGRQRGKLAAKSISHDLCLDWVFPFFLCIPLVSFPLQRHRQQTLSLFSTLTSKRLLRSRLLSFRLSVFLFPLHTVYSLSFTTPPSLLFVNTVRWPGTTEPNFNEDCASESTASIGEMPVSLCSVFRLLFR